MSLRSRFGNFARDHKKLMKAGVCALCFMAATSAFGREGIASVSQSPEVAKKFAQPSHAALMESMRETRAEMRELTGFLQDEASLIGAVGTVEATAVNAQYAPVLAGAANEAELSRLRAKKASYDRDMLQDLLGLGVDKARAEMLIAQYHAAKTEAEQRAFWSELNSYLGVGEVAGDEFERLLDDPTGTVIRWAAMGVKAAAK